MGKRPHRETHDSSASPLALEVRSRLRDDSPLELLTYASALLEAACHGSGDDVDLAVLVETLTVVDRLETTALLAALSQLLPADNLRVATRRALMRRSHPLPSWLRDVENTSLTEAVVVTGGEPGVATVLLGVRWPGGESATVVAALEGAGETGAFVGDAWVSPHPWRVVTAEFGAACSDDSHPMATVGGVVETVDIAVACATVTEAIERSTAERESLRSEDWPANRLLLRWLLERVPPGSARP